MWSNNHDSNNIAELPLFKLQITALSITFTDMYIQYKIDKWTDVASDIASSTNSIGFDITGT